MEPGAARETVESLDLKSREIVHESILIVVLDLCKRVEAIERAIELKEEREMKCS